MWSLIPDYKQGCSYLKPTQSIDLCYGRFHDLEDLEKNSRILIRIFLKTLGKKFLGCTRNKLRIFVFNVISKLLIFYFFDTEFSNLRKMIVNGTRRRTVKILKNHFYEPVKAD